MKTPVVERSYSAVGVGLYDTLAHVGAGGGAGVPAQKHFSKKRMDAAEATLLGYTHDELKTYFPESLKRIAAANGFSKEEIIETLEGMASYYYLVDEIEKIVGEIND